ncbi:hypothetical protein IFM89_009514, partial [Coptis chinensis]
QVRKKDIPFSSDDETNSIEEEDEVSDDEVTNDEVVIRNVDREFDSDWETDEDDGIKYEKPQGDSWTKEMDKIRGYFEDPSKIVTFDMINNIFIATRVRKGIARLEEIEQLTLLAEFAKIPAQKVDILVYIVWTQLKVVPRGHVPVTVWKKCMQNMLVIVDILEENLKIVLDDSGEFGFEDISKGINCDGEVRIWRAALPDLYAWVAFEFCIGMKSARLESWAYKEMLRCEPVLLLLSQKDKVQHLDASTKILFNRTMAQLGLCAFRAGLIAEAHSYLSELYADGSIKKLLCQVPNMAVKTHDAKGKVISKTFRPFCQGDFHKSFNLIKSFDFWRFLGNDNVLEMLMTKIKEVALENPPVRL